MVFSKVSASIKSGIFSGGNFQNFIGSKSAHVFGSKSFVLNRLRFPKSASRFLAKVLAGKRFHFAKSAFSGLHFFWQNQASKIDYIFSAKVFASLVRALVVELVETFCQVYFFWQICFSAKSVFSKGFGKFSASAFW